MRATTASTAHLPERAEQVAIIWEGDDPQESLSITYRQLRDEVSRLANALKARGVKKGDRVCIYIADGAASCLRDAGMRAQSGPYIPSVFGGSSRHSRSGSESLTPIAGS